MAKDNLIKFPVWQFLCQPVFSSENKLILNPRRFESTYRIKFLERCLAKELGAKDSYSR